jgi:GNAT superfamily N-acetyltransferase
MITDQLTVSDRVYTVRSATREDIPAIVALLADDVLGRGREITDADLAPYLAAFDRIAAHPNQELIVVERNGAIAGTMDLSILASLSRRGTLRLQIEAVRVAASERGAGLGDALFRWVVDHARRQGCGLVQLTTDRARADAHRFYERLGFAPSHIGYKLDLNEWT